FSDDVEPLITNLEKHFTSYELEQVSNLTSVYAIRLYELLIAWRSTGKVAMIGLDELRSKLGIEPHEYKRMGQFKEKVLHLAIEQINDHTDIKADYEQHKKGRSIVGFSFSFKQKTKPKPVKQQRDPDTLDMFCDMSDAQIKTYSSILSKVHSISDLAGNKDYSAFAVWIGNVLRDPASVREETAKRVFKALRTETDFKG
ncbi:replication initiation protein, partial [Acinetobacter baumannii]|nr:replication initiation protein [Acinetobacter baumannii]